ncbi:MAG: insulinase family protein, partial [Candidatus Dadabacteria bacterium]
MKRKLTVSAVICALLLAFVALGCTTIKTQRELSSFPIKTPDYSEPVIEEWVEHNGLRVLYIRDDELPLVYGTLYVKGGTYWQNADQLGLYGALGDQMRDGGAGDYTPDKLDLVLDGLAAGVSSSFGSEYGTVRFSCFDKDIEKVFSIFADVVLRPRFDPNRLSSWKKKKVDSIKRRVENPQLVAMASLMQILYDGTPYGYVSTSEDIKKISRLDLLRLHRRIVRPKDSVLVISGNISKDKVKELLRKNFGRWKGKNHLSPLPPVVEEPKPAIYFIERPLVQATVVMGELGVPRLTADDVAIDVFNDVFGTSSFGAPELFKVVRERLGLAYTVYGSIQPAVKKGVNIIFFQTKSKSVFQGIKASLGVLKMLQGNVLPKERIEMSKNFIGNSFVFKFASKYDVISRKARMIMLNYPPDYDKIYLEKLKEISNKDIRDVARNRWDIERLVIVVVGNKEAYNTLEKERKYGREVWLKE